MKISYNWLKEFINLRLSPEEVSEKLLHLGFDTTTMTKIGREIENVVVGKVLEVLPHPKADRLRLAVVTDGRIKQKVVCGAPNLSAGQSIVFARVGAKLPGGMLVREAEIRGEKSPGMICSERELDIGDNHSGILVLENGIRLGQDIRDVLGLNDTIIDLEVTPNRPDVLSHIGVARELASVTGSPLKIPKSSVRESHRQPLSISIQEKRVCRRYIGRLIRGIQVNPSPLWLKQRLRMCGVRPINNVVDITNYVLLEMGQPLHAFDSEKLLGNKIIVRFSTKGESIFALDGKTYALTPDMLVIADRDRPVALAGIIGGEETAVQNGTKDILLESAHFWPASIRKTRTSLGVSTESSYRFERGVSWEGVEVASRRAASLILNLAGGKVEGVKDVVGQRPLLKKISFSIPEASRLLGFELRSHEVKRSLKRLGFSISSDSGGKLICRPPSYRLDIEGPHDLAEEVARFIGYKKIPSRNASIHLGQHPVLESRRRNQFARRTMLSCGLTEALHDSFVSSASLKVMGIDVSQSVSVLNPISQDKTFMRPSLLTSLLESFERNIHRQVPGLSLFELGRVFYYINGKVKEETHLAWIIGGEFQPLHWRRKPRSADYYDGKGPIKVLSKIWPFQAKFREGAEIPLFEAGSVGSIIVDSRNVGMVGQLSRKIKVASLGVVMGELRLEWLPSLQVTQKFKGLPRMPAVFRDLSIYVPKIKLWEDVDQVVREAIGSTLEDIQIFDFYQGKGVPEGFSSMTFRLTLRDPSHTLTENEISQVIQKIVDVVESQLGGRLRPY